MRKLMLLLFTLACAGVLIASPYFQVKSEIEWAESLFPGGNGFIEPISPIEWNDYMHQWNMNLMEGDPYPPNQFYPAELYPHNGSGLPEPGEGLIMAWGDDAMQDGSYSSGWAYQYDVDPDLSNAVITVSVMPPSGAQINAISFGIQDINGNIRSWWWSCGPGGTLPWDVKTTLTIDCSVVGLNAANPVANGFTSAPGFDITQSVVFLADENAQWVGGPTPIVPGQQIGRLWNYWYDLSVMNKSTRAYKWFFKKFSQPPTVFEDGTVPPMIYGWDQVSFFERFEGQPGGFIIAADDWICKDPRPVTDVHWWGSFQGWTQPYPPAIVPDYFHISIWTDSPQSLSPTIPPQYSQPLECVWTHKCDNWVWNFAGYDEDPRCMYPDLCGIYPWICRPTGIGCVRDEACFQFNQLLSEDDWFYQDPLEGERVYWLAIAAVYVNIPITQVQYPWGWKTKVHETQDIAVIIDDVTGAPPINVGSKVNSFWPLVLPHYDQPDQKFDLAFELSTNEKEPGTCYDIPGDINHDCIVNLFDFQMLAFDWLATSTP